jgi:hypothetical protein
MPDDVAEDPPWFELEDVRAAVLVQHLAAGDVGRQQIRRELDGVFARPGRLSNRR